MIDKIKKLSALAMALVAAVAVSLAPPAHAAWTLYNSGATLPTGTDTNYGTGITNLISFLVFTFTQAQVIFILLMAVSLYITYRLAKILLARFRGH